MATRRDYEESEKQKEPAATATAPQEGTYSTLHGESPVHLCDSTDLRTNLAATVLGFTRTAGRVAATLRAATAAVDSWGQATPNAEEGTGSIEQD